MADDIKVNLLEVFLQLSIAEQLFLTTGSIALMGLGFTVGKSWTSKKVDKVESEIAKVELEKANLDFQKVRLQDKIDRFEQELQQNDVPIPVDTKTSNKESDIPISNVIGWNKAPSIDFAIRDSRSGEAIEFAILREHELNRETYNQVRHQLIGSLIHHRVDWEVFFIDYKEHLHGLLEIETQLSNGGTEVKWYLRPDANDITLLKKLNFCSKITLGGVVTGDFNIVKTRIISVTPYEPQNT